MLILVSAVCIFAAIVLFSLSFGREEVITDLRPQANWQKSINEKVRIRLRRAGYLETEPGFYYLICCVIMGAVALLLLLLAKNFWLPLVSIPFVMMSTWFYLNSRERSYLKRASKEMVPFLNRVQTAVGAGSSPQNAFLESIKSTKLMREAMKDEMRALALNEPMSKVLRESVEKFPLRAWEQFVRHLVMQIERGGDLENILASSVEQIQGLIELQAELRADYAEAQREQILIILFAVGALLGMNFVMGGVFLNMFTSLIGWIGFILGMGMIVGGIWFGQKNVKEIEERLDF